VAAERPDWFEPRPGDRVDADSAQAALEALDDVPRQVVVLRVWSGLTLAETAGVVGLPLSTVHDHYRRALATLRATIGRTDRVAARTAVPTGRADGRK
jgi:DNA-directed RNA polymerase specialized sigma24 family protein